MYKLVLAQLYVKLSDPPLNVYLHTMPIARGANILHDERSYHWHMTIFPRLTIWAGFEYATGIPINPVSPEDAAKFLKNDKAHHCKLEAEPAHAEGGAKNCGCAGQGPHEK